jgi:hypothetical protein
MIYVFSVTVTSVTLLVSCACEALEGVDIIFSFPSIIGNVDAIFSSMSVRHDVLWVPLRVTRVQEGGFDSSLTTAGATYFLFHSE